MLDVEDDFADLRDEDGDEDEDEDEAQERSHADALAAGVVEPVLFEACDCGGAAWTLGCIPDQAGSYGPSLYWRRGSMHHLWLGREQAREMLVLWAPTWGLAEPLTPAPPGEFQAVTMMCGVARYERRRTLADGRVGATTPPVLREWSTGDRRPA